MAPIDGIERAILAFAVHPDGGGFDRAHLLVHDPLADQLVAWSGVAATPGRDSLDEAMSRAALAPETRDGDQPRRVRWGVDDLGGTGALAWDSGVAFAAASEGGSPEGAIRLERGTARHGLVVGAWSSDIEPSSGQSRLERLHRIAARLLSAWARHDSVRRAQAQADALAELARGGASSQNMAELLHDALQRVTMGEGDVAAAVWVRDAEPGCSQVRLRLSRGPAGLRDEGARALEGLAATTVETGRPLWWDPAGNPGSARPAECTGLARLAILPLTTYERTHGALGVWQRVHERPDRPGPWQADQQVFWCAVADLMALAFDQAERRAQLRATEAQTEELKRRLRRIEWRAERGAWALQAAESVRSPLTSITAFARRLKGAFGPEAPEQEYLDVLVREAEHIERLLCDRMTSDDTPTQGWAVESPNPVVQEAVQKQAELLVRRRIRLVKKLAPEVPRLRMDAARLREAVTAMLQHALDAVPVAGRMRVETRRSHGQVLIEVAHDGLRAPGAALEDLDGVFGTGPDRRNGLAIAQRIVAELGGELRIRSEGEWSAISVLSLPILGNEDRRRASERRGACRDRREVGPAHRPRG